MSADTPIPDKAVTAAAAVAAAKVLFSEDYHDPALWDRASQDVQRRYIKTARVALEAATPHLATSPSSAEKEVESLRARLENEKHRAASQRSVDHGEIVNHTITIGRLNDEILSLRQRLADRDTETAELKATIGRLFDERMQRTIIRQMGKIGDLVSEIEHLRSAAILGHVHGPACTHVLTPLDVPGVHSCDYCGDHYTATQFCPDRCDIVRIEHDHATSLRGEQ